MNIIIFLFTVFSFVNSFKLMEHVHFNFNPGDIVYCKDIDEGLLKVTQDIVEEINIGTGLDLLVTDSIQRSYLNNTSICNEQVYGNRFGYFVPPNKITIANKVLNYENTLFNVVMHEILHFLGLNHSKYKGMMNYKVRLTQDIYSTDLQNYNPYGSMNFFNRYNGLTQGLKISDDQTKLWLSIDDYLGLIEIYL